MKSFLLISYLSLLIDIIYASDKTAFECEPKLIDKCTCEYNITVNENVDKYEIACNLDDAFPLINSQVIDIRKALILKIRSRLTVLPDFNLSNLMIEELNAENTSMKNISINAFNKVKCLKILNLAHNQIKLIKQSTFEPIYDTLEILILKKNQLKEMPNLFNLKKIQTVDLSHNSIRIIANQNNSIFPKSIIEFRINNNKLNQISENYFKDLDNLVKINLSYNRISQIESNSFVNLLNLEVIDLSYNCIHSLSSDWFKLNSIKPNLIFYYTNQTMCQNRDNTDITSMLRISNYAFDIGQNATFYIDDNYLSIFQNASFCLKNYQLNLIYSLNFANSVFITLNMCLLNELAENKIFKKETSAILWLENDSDKCNCGLVNYFKRKSLNVIIKCVNINGQFEFNVNTCNGIDGLDLDCDEYRCDKSIELTTSNNLEFNIESTTPASLLSSNRKICPKQ